MRRHGDALFIVAGALLVVAGLAAQAAQPTIAITQPAAGSTVTGPIAIAATVTGTAAGPLVARLAPAGATAPPVAVPLTLSATGAYVGIVPAPAVPGATAYQITVTDGASTATAAFSIAPASAGSGGGTTPAPSGTHEDILATLAVYQRELLLKIAQVTAAVAPMPTPQGTACKLVSTTTIYSGTGHYKFTMDCPPVFGSRMPSKNDTIVVLGEPSAIGVIK